MIILLKDRAACQNRNRNYQTRRYISVFNSMVCAMGHGVCFFLMPFNFYGQMNLTTDLTLTAQITSANFEKKKIACKWNEKERRKKTKFAPVHSQSNCYIYSYYLYYKFVYLMRKLLLCAFLSVVRWSFARTRSRSLDNRSKWLICGEQYQPTNRANEWRTRSKIVQN